MNTESVFCEWDEFMHIYSTSRTTVRCSHSALSVNKLENKLKKKKKKNPVN